MGIVKKGGFEQYMVGFGRLKDSSSRGTIDVDISLGIC